MSALDVTSTNLKKGQGAFAFTNVAYVSGGTMQQLLDIVDSLPPGACFPAAESDTFVQRYGLPCEVEDREKFT